MPNGKERRSKNKYLNPSKNWHWTHTFTLFAHNLYTQLIHTEHNIIIYFINGYITHTHTTNTHIHTLPYSIPACPWNDRFWFRFAVSHFSLDKISFAHSAQHTYTQTKRSKPKYHTHSCIYIYTYIFYIFFC